MNEVTHSGISIVYEWSMWAVNHKCLKDMFNNLSSQIIFPVNKYSQSAPE